MPALLERRGEPLVAHVRDEVVVGHHRERNAHVELARLVDHRGGRGAEIERALARLLDGLAVHDRVGERDADLDGVGAGSPRTRAHDLDPVLAEAAGDVRDEQLAPRVASGSRRCFSRITWLAQTFHDLLRVLVAAAREREQHVAPLGHRPARLTHQPADGVRGLERGDDALGFGEELEPGDRLVVGGVLVRGPARGREQRVLGADARDSRGPR